MTDEFDAFLSAVLAPPDRAEDLDFARRVQQRIRLEQVEQAVRSRAIRQFMVQLLSLASIGAGLALGSRSVVVAQLAESAPHLLLGGVLTLLAGWCWIVVGNDNGRISAA
jgi:hypothetical protein